MAPPTIRSAPAARDLSVLPMLLIVGTVVFNPLLAIVNAHVAGLTPAAVIGSEVILISAAHGVSLLHYKPQMTRWYGLIGVLVLIALYRSLATGGIEAKYLRDVLIIPTFVILGLASGERHLNRTVVAIHALVIAVLLLEALDTSAYSSLFKIQDYYINTRGYVSEDFWNKESELYVSAVRPDERLFSFIDLHRLSSLFLEPVSLGNYCIVITIFICARYRQLAPAARWFLIAGNLAAIVGSDGRLAAMTSVIIIAVAWIAPRLPSYAAVLYVPVTTAFAFAVVNLGGFRAGADNFSGRIAHTVELLERFDVPEFLGISDRFMSFAVDSGLAYLVTTQSILGAMLLCAFIVYASPENTDQQVRLKHGICVYVAFTMMVSFAFLSIKTAALLWFVYGVVGKARRRPAVRTDAAALPAVPHPSPAGRFRWRPVGPLRARPLGEVGG